MSSLKPPHYQVSPYFLHMRSLISLFDMALTDRLVARIERVSQLNPLERKAFFDKELIGYALTLIQERRISSLEELLLGGNVKQKEGQLTTFHRPAYFKGASVAIEKEQKGQKAYAEFHSKLSEFDVSVEGEFSPEHFTYSSSAMRLSGRGTRFMLAVIDEVTTKTIILRPILIGDRIYDNGEKTSAPCPVNKFHIFPEDIDEFSKLAPSDEKRLDVNLLKKIPESQIKELFAQILNEKNVPKDRGGETSDLSTLKVSGQKRLSFLRGHLSFTNLHKRI